MGVEGMPRTAGVQTAKLVCDGCGRGEVIPCSYEGTWKSSRGTRPSAKEANRKAVSKSWAIVKDGLFCPACDAKRRAASAKPKWLQDAEVMVTKEANMAKTETASVTPIRKPTPKQERLIILALEDAYDDQAKRYKGKETDKTIADDLGDGIMFGWVAEVRERLFGPTGRNEEIEAIQAEINALRDDFAKRVSALDKRLDAVVAAVGPKAARVG